MNKICPKPDIQCTSVPQTKKISFLWTIEKFSDLPEEVGLKIESSVFNSDSDDKTKWYLCLYPNGYGEENDFVAVFLCLQVPNEKGVSVNYKLALIDDKQKIYKEFGSKQLFKTGLGTRKFVHKSELKDPTKHLLPNNKFTIYCEVIAFDKCQTKSLLNTDLKRKHKTITDDIEVLFQNGSGCDVEIVVSGHKFNAHKVILMARSPVFEAMFNSQMKESQQNRVDIKDIDKEVFAKLLRFIYTDKVTKEVIESNIKLFMAADKYNLDKLKSICEEYISSQISVETVSEVLILADNHSAQELKVKAIDFIKTNSIQVMKTNGWKKIMDKKDLLDLF